MTSQPDLDALRDRVRALDRELVRLAAERVRTVRRIGEAKRAAGRPMIDYAQERRVLEAARGAAAEEGLDPGVAEDLLARLIRAAVTAQEEESLRHAATGEGRTAVVVGGAGRMGGWFVRFLDAQGWGVEIVDPAAPAVASLRGEALLPEADLVICATPPRETVELYRGWLERPPRGVVADLASIKSPLLGPIAELRAAGGRVASLHPMFGPATVLLRSKDVVLCETGDEEATEEIAALFRPTTVQLVRLPLAEHDELMAHLLSVGHAAAIAFALALPDRELPVRSTTYGGLARLAANAVDQNPDVYFEIQVDNPHSLAALEGLRDAVDHVVAVVRTHRRDRFAELMEEGRRRLPPGEDRRMADP